MCEKPARGVRGPARCEGHFRGNRRLGDCRACGADRSDEAATRQSHSGLCVVCRSACKVCGKTRSTSRSARGLRLCDEHLREHERSKRKRAACGVCGCPGDGKGRRALCAPCRSKCLKCGGQRTGRPLRCNACVRAQAFVDYRKRNGIPLSARAEKHCRECGKGLVAADNHYVVSVVRNYCSDACRNRAKCRRRRVQRAGRPVERYAAVEVFERDRWVCRLCDEPIDRQAKWPAPKSPSIDHIVPVSLGGADVVANVQAAHFACNIAKSNRMVA